MMRLEAARPSTGTMAPQAPVKRRGGREAMELFFHLLFLLCGAVAVAFVLFISIYLIVSGLPAIREIGLVNFLFGTTWAPTATTVEPSYGILPFILTSVYGTAGAVLIGVPIGLMTAMFLAKVAPPRAARVIKSAVELLAGIPSVVYGLVGMIVMVPAIRELFDLSSGACLLAAIIVLTIMILPSIINVSETALRAVPREYEEASWPWGPRRSRPISGCLCPPRAAAWQRLWSWAWAVPSARPWPSSWWRAMWPICRACSPPSASSPPPSPRRCPTLPPAACSATPCTPSAWCCSCSSC